MSWKLYYTPHALVDELIDLAGYTFHVHKRVLDPACGDGRFLVAIARRILSSSLSPKAKRDLLSLIEGWDIDGQAIEEARHNLDQLVRPYGIKVDWKLRQVDSLSMYRDAAYAGIYDLVIGNPPYMRVQNMPEDVRERVKGFSFCKRGTSDLYMAFVELGLSLLSDDGILAYVLPNSWLYAQGAATMRDVLRDGLLKAVVDYDDVMHFGRAGVYVSLVVLSKARQSSWIYIRKQRWSKVMPATKLPQDIDEDKPKLGDIAFVGVGLTTLADDVFIVKRAGSAYKNKGGELINIEPDILKPVIKASQFRGDDSWDDRYIIFPYVLQGGRYKLMDEAYLREVYPKAYSYLLKHKERLLARDKGKLRAAWYAFGRHQNMTQVFGRKIVVPPMMKEPSFYLSELTTHAIYDGYFIKYDGDYNWLVSLLNSDEMKRHISVLGRPFRGGWRGVNKRVLVSFPLPQ